LVDLAPACQKTEVTHAIIDATLEIICWRRRNGHGPTSDRFVVSQIAPPREPQALRVPRRIERRAPRIVDKQIRIEPRPHHEWRSDHPQRVDGQPPDGYSRERRTRQPHDRTGQPRGERTHLGTRYRN